VNDSMNPRSDAITAFWSGTGQAYYGENYRRLRHVKAAYDPGNMFRFHQSLPLR
jgi:FAD/FMN-containing dehydrogenase